MSINKVTQMRAQEERFRQLMDCADDGDESAAQDLWLEYGVVYGRDAT